MRHLYSFLLFLCLLLTTQAIGKPNLDSHKRYTIVCTLFPGGCVTDGYAASAHTPLSYLTSATANDNNLWILEEQEEGQYTIKNAGTGKYITYDGKRANAASAADGLTRRYVDMTDVPAGNNSYWSFHQQSDGVYVIRNVAAIDHLWDVRTDSYVVGTYSNTGNINSNQMFSLYNEGSNLVVENTTPEEGFNVTSWLDATSEAFDNWTVTGGWFLNFGEGGSHYNYSDGSSLVNPFIENWHDSSQGSLSDCSLSQLLTHLPAGKYTLQADMMAVRQKYGVYSNTPATNVQLYAGSANIAVATNNDPPQRFRLDFTLNETSDIEIGVRASGTNANWIAIDNLKLFFHGTQQQLMTGEHSKVLADLEGRMNEETYRAQVDAIGDDFEQLEILRKKIVSMPEPDPLSKAATGLTINGRSINYAKSINLYLCSVSLNSFGNDLNATINYTPKTGSGNLFIDGNEVAPGTNYTFAGVNGSKTYNLSIIDANGNNISIPLTFTSLPVVNLYGTFNNEYSEGFIGVSEPTSKGSTEMLNMKAKWRGGITNSNGKHKRNYHVKLKNDSGDKLEKKFFGLRKDNSWILEACQVDMLRIRNRTLTDLWNDYSAKPYYIDQEPNALTGTRGNFVELIFNGEYNGIYCMTENLDRKQMKLKKYDETANVTHGQLWKSKDWSYAVFMGTIPDGGYYPKDYLSDTNENSEMWDSYQVKYPDFEDYGNKTDWSVLYNAVDFVCHSTDDEFRQHIAEYFDLPVVIDYYILMETILSTDNHGKNMFFGVYDKQKDKKITFSVWDMDATCGQRWSDYYYHWSGLDPEQDYSNFISTYEHGDYNLFRRLRDTNANSFNDRVRKRYRDLRQDKLATESILNRFQNYINEFKTAGADKREYARWNYDSDIEYHELDFDNEMDYLTDWFTRRMNYLDKTRFDISSLPKKGDVDGDGTTDIADAVAIVNHVVGKSTPKFNEIAADVNNDGDIDIADAVQIVNMVVGKSQ